MVKPTRFDRKDSLGSKSHDQPAVSQRSARRGAVAGWLWIMVPPVGIVAAWSLGGGHLVDPRTQKLLEVLGITLVGVVGLLLAFFVRNSNVRVERAYSTHLEKLSERLRSLAYRDSLTDLYNHRFFQEQLSHEVERANRYRRPVSVILMDLDRFKEVNDTHGHLVGDKLLTFIGRVIRDQVRSADIAARYGGDEFAIILTDTPKEAAEAAAEKLANAIATDHAYAGLTNEGLPISASYGVASCPDEARSVSELLQIADDRMYAAKAARSQLRRAAGQ